MGARRVPRRARRPAARRQRARGPVRAPARVPRRAHRLRGRVGAGGRRAVGGRPDRDTGADGPGGGLRSASGAVAAGRAVPTRAATEGHRGLVRGRGGRAGARTGARRSTGRRGRLALGLPRERPVRAGGGAVRAALAAGVTPARRAANRHPRSGAFHPGAERHRVRADRGCRRRLDEPRRARGRGDGDRGGGGVRRHRAPRARPAVRRPRAGAPGRRVGRARDSRRVHRDARDAVRPASVRAVRPGRLGPRLRPPDRPVRSRARPRRDGRWGASRKVRPAWSGGRRPPPGGRRLRGDAVPLRRQLARARAGRHRGRRLRLRLDLPAGDGGGHERSGDGEGGRRGRGEPGREAGRRRPGRGDRGQRVRGGLRRQAERRQQRARRGEGVDRGCEGGGERPPRARLGSTF